MPFSENIQRALDAATADEALSQHPSTVALRALPEDQQGSLPAMLRCFFDDENGRYFRYWDKPPLLEAILSDYGCETEYFLGMASPESFCKGLDALEKRGLCTPDNVGLMSAQQEPGYFEQCYVLRQLDDHDLLNQANFDVLFASNPNPVHLICGLNNFVTSKERFDGVTTRAAIDLTEDFVFGRIAIPECEYSDQDDDVTDPEHEYYDTIFRNPDIKNLVQVLAVLKGRRMLTGETFDIVTSHTNPYGLNQVLDKVTRNEWFDDDSLMCLCQVAPDELDQITADLEKMIAGETLDKEAFIELCSEHLAPMTKSGGKAAAERRQPNNSQMFSIATPAAATSLPPTDPNDNNDYGCPG